MDRPCGRPTRGGGPPALVNRTSSGPFRRRSVASWSPGGAMTPACRPPVRARQRAQLPVPVGEPGGSYGSEFVAAERGCQRTSRKPRKFFESSYLSRGTRAQCPLAADPEVEGQSGAGASTSAVAIAAMPSPRPVSPSPSVVVADTDTGAPTAAESAASASARRGPSRGTVADDLDGDVADLEAGGAHPPRGLLEQGHAGRARPRRVRRTEVAAQVAEPGGREQRVARGVRRDVRVRVTLEALRLVRPGETGEVQGYAVDESMHVGTDADPVGPGGVCVTWRSCLSKNRTV